MKSSSIRIGLCIASIVTVALLPPVAAADHDRPLDIVGDQVDHATNNVETVGETAFEAVQSVRDDAYRFCSC